MDVITIARALHVAAIVHWIGGVAMVTLVILPAIRRNAPPEQRLPLFEAIEGRFAGQARISTLIAGLSGLYMTHQMNDWDRFLEPGFWWMHAMVAVWLIFTLMLFVAEPLFLHRWFHERAAGGTGANVLVGATAPLGALEPECGHRRRRRPRSARYALLTPAGTWVRTGGNSNQGVC